VAGIHCRATQDSAALAVRGAPQHCGNSAVSGSRPSRARALHRPAPPRYTGLDHVRRKMKTRVFVVMHEHDLDGCDDVKFIGVYSTARRGRAAVARAKGLPGFRDHPGGFSVDAHEVDRTHWPEGFKPVWLGKGRPPSSR
jgi:hypothetical protein